MGSYISKVFPTNTQVFFTLYIADSAKAEKGDLE